ncbi:MAG: TolC family protein [Candidatus Latescibacteria bacterium]|nr:TolC family protein [Candidatus Latescibacterota bacterium]
MARYLTSVMILWLFLGTSLSAAQQTAPLQLSLQQAVSMALENNETFLSAQMETGKSRSRYREALSEALPSLSLNTVYTRNWSLQELNFGGQRFRLGTDNAMNMRLDFSQPIYSGGKLRAGLKLASYFREQTDANEEAVRQNVALSVHQSYYAVVLADAILKVNEASYERAVVQFGQVSKFNAAGTVSPYDVLRAEVQVANSKPPVIQAKNRLAVAKARLKSLIGVRQTTGVTIRSDLNAEYNIPSSLEEALQTATQKRPDVMAARLQTDMMDRSIIVARSEGRPDVSVSAGYQMQAQVNDGQVNGLGFGDFTRSLNTQLNISIPIFDGRQTSSRVSQAEADYELAQFSESRLNRQVEVDVTEAFLNVQEATDRISAAQEAVALAQRGLEIARVQYGAGMSTQLEVLDAELALTQAQTNHVTAKHDYAVTAAILESVQGILEVGPR